MRARVSTCPTLHVGVALTLLATSGLCAAKPQSPSVAPAGETQIPQSVFVTPENPKESRNPFFPKSNLGQQRIKTGSTIPEFSSLLVLNGITSPPKRTAMINGRTFEQGEEGEVKLPGGGKVLLKCLEIRKDSALIIVNGTTLELRLRVGLLKGLR